VIRDPNQMNSAEWAARGALMPATPKRKTSSVPSEPNLKSIKGMSYSDSSKSLHKEIQTGLASQKQPGNAAPKPETQSWQPVDFSRGAILKKGISNTKNFRYQLDKQLKGVFAKSGQRAAVSKMIQDKITGSGLTSKNVKRGLWDLKNQGHITTGQMNKLMGHFKI